MINGEENWERCESKGRTDLLPMRTIILFILVVVVRVIVSVAVAVRMRV